LMTVTVASFRKDLPEFASVTAYPDMVIQYWLSIGTLLMGLAQGSPPQVCSFTGAVGTGPNPSAILTVSAVAFGSLTLLPLLLEGTDVPVNCAVAGQLTGATGGVGTYQLSSSALIAAEPMVAVQTGIGVGSNPFWGASSVVATSPPTTVADFALEMWTAHQIVLEKQALDAARVGGDPGTKIGIINSKSVNGVSVGFDTSAVAGTDGVKGAGYYNQTMYGMRFWRLAKARSGGPIQIGIGRPPFAFMAFGNWGFLGSSNAWAGPYPGIGASDTGFG
jgi:hypothetical protein